MRAMANKFPLPGPVAQILHIAADALDRLRADYAATVGTAS